MNKEFVVSANKFTSNMLQEIFKEVKYNKCKEKRRIEQDILYYCINLLDEVECGLVKEFIQIYIIKSGVEKERNVKIKLEDVLCFLTGCKFLSSNISSGTYSTTKQKKEDELKLELAHISLNFQLTGDAAATNSAEI